MVLGFSPLLIRSIIIRKLGHAYSGSDPLSTTPVTTTMSVLKLVIVASTLVVLIWRMISTRKEGKIMLLFPFTARSLFISVFWCLLRKPLFFRTAKAIYVPENILNKAPVGRIGESMNSKVWVQWISYKKSDLLLAIRSRMNFNYEKNSVKWRLRYCFWLSLICHDSGSNELPRCYTFNSYWYFERTLCVLGFWTSRREFTWNCHYTELFVRQLRLKLNSNFFLDLFLNSF